MAHLLVCVPKFTVSGLSTEDDGRKEEEGLGLWADGLRTTGANLPFPSPLDFETDSAKTVLRPRITRN